MIKSHVISSRLAEWTAHIHHNTFDERVQNILHRWQLTHPNNIIEAKETQLLLFYFVDDVLKVTE